MPNWCECELRIKAKKALVDEILSSVENKEDCGPSEKLYFDFGQVIPYPDEYKLADAACKKWHDIFEHVPFSQRPPRPKDGYNSGGYDWCISNWGTKWNACNVHIARTTRGCTIRFTTAWSPPVPVIVALSEKFPDALFDLKYFEGGMGFQGRAVYEAGHGCNDESEYRGRRGG